MKNKLDDNQPIYLQIKEIIEDQVMNGSIQTGERVPSTNELAKFYGINPATARQGMNELVQENILRKQRGVGMFVTDDAKEILMRKRRQLFYEDFVAPLLAEAEKLAIPKEQIMKMLKKEGRVDEN